jgi:NAD(P)-dependent dehydrogenase (short-subunit alcohol dehydrogenase family)
VGIARASIVHMSSSVGSIAENASGGRTGGYAYRCSKSALNQMMKSMSVDLKENGILIMSMHPGWVQTDMGGANADITTETCCSTMVKTLEGLTEKDDGSFKRYDNSIIPW